jgi:hypothetical protein
MCQLETCVVLAFAEVTNLPIMMRNYWRLVSHTNNLFSAFTYYAPINVMPLPGTIGGNIGGLT